MRTLKPWRALLVVAAMGTLLSGCVPTYTLVKAESVKVAKGHLTVQPSIAWNRVPRGPYDIVQEENWTQNGPLLDTIGFIAALPDGQAITKQRPKDDRKVPVFRASMTPQDLISMIESFYRIKAGANVFETQGVKPVQFLGVSGVEFNYSYVGADEIKRRGRSVLAISDGKLYLMTLDGASLHYFDAALPEFEKLTATAKIS